MKDCRLTLTVKQGKVNVQAENISLVELAKMAGTVQMMAGMEALKRGQDLDWVKDRMLDIHLAAMELLERQEERSRGGEKEKDDSPGKEGAGGI